MLAKPKEWNEHKTQRTYILCLTKRMERAQNSKNLYLGLTAPLTYAMGILNLPKAIGTPQNIREIHSKSNTTIIESVL